MNTPVPHRGFYHGVQAACEDIEEGLDPEWLTRCPITGAKIAPQDEFDRGFLRQCEIWPTLIPVPDDLPTIRPKSIAPCAPAAFIGIALFLGTLLAAFGWAMPAQVNGVLGIVATISAVAGWRLGRKDGDL